MFFVSKDKSLPNKGRLFDCSYNCNHVYIYVYNDSLSSSLSR